MAIVTPMLDDVELEQVQTLEVDGDQVLVRHGVPAMEGDFLQVLGRRATRISLSGVLTGAEVADGLKALREKFRAAAPVDFVADISTAVRVDQVLIEQMGVRELAGKPARFEYAFSLREYTAATAPGKETPPPVIPPQKIETGTLVVTVIVEGRPNHDFSTVTVRASGDREDGTRIDDQPLTNRNENVWTENEFPPGSYTITATTEVPESLTGSAQAVVRAGQTTSVTIILRPGQAIAKAFIVHFWFDKAFVEPCQRHALRDVAAYAAAHPAEKMVIVGHTDLVGSDAYNQSLSERRGRSVYAYLIAGRDRAAALAEWNELRQRRPAGQLPSIKDTWSVREYQYMLQDLGFYSGNIDEDHGPQTDDAVRTFQEAHGLTADGIVGDQTWQALVADYLDQEPVSVPESQFLPNCPPEILKWLGCSEQDPVRNTQDAWRPNRRTEILFVNASELPCEVPEPVTFNLPAPGAVNGSWCLGPGDPDRRCCFLTREAAQPDKWLVVPAEPGSVTVAGSIRFADGTPVPDLPYVLIAPDGEFMDGERPSGSGRGRPVKGATDANGAFAYPQKPKGVGVYTLEIEGPYVIRLAEDPPAEAKGSFVCKRLEDGGGTIDVVVIGQAAAQVQPSLLPGAGAVIVRKAHTAPQRQPVTLGVSQPFSGSGTFTRSSDAIRFFDAAVGGSELAFDGSDNVFGDAQLAAGVTLFAEAARASTAVDDVTLTLALTVNGQPGRAATAQMTAVELTLDVAVSRTAPGVDPALLAEADKVGTGRFVQVADPAFTHERAMLVVRPVQPAGFAGDLALTPLSGRVALFADETPATGQAALPTPHVINAAAIPAAGTRLFVEGVSVSTAARDTGIQLGLHNVEPDGDRVPMTTVQIEAAEEGTAAAPAITFARFGLWDQAYNAAGDVRNAAAEADNFAGLDRRRLHFRVRDPAVTATHLNVDWKTVAADRRSDVDAPASQQLTLPGAAGTFISRGVLLVTDNTDRDQETHSGLAAPLPDPGLRARGQSNHRLRRATIDGFVRAEYTPQPGVRLPLLLPVFERDPDERRRLNVRVVRYTNAADATYVPATAAYIDGQVSHANDRWNQIGLQIDAAATADRPIPAAALNAGGRYAGSANNAFEQAALADLIPITPDNTVTAVFVHMTGANAYATIAARAPVPLPAGGTATLDDRYFIFINTTLALTDETLAHELAHVLFNRFDAATARRFYTLNTSPPSALVIGTGIALPDPRIYRRIQNLNSPDPNADPTNDNIVNWARRARGARQPIAPADLSAATATTGNNLIGPF